MELHKKGIFFSSHAYDRAIERTFEISEIRKCLKNGFICEDPKQPNNNLCIYKVRNRYYTIVFCEYYKAVVIITVYSSSSREIAKARGDPI